MLADVVWVVCIEGEKDLAGITESALEGTIDSDFSHALQSAGSGLSCKAGHLAPVRPRAPGDLLRFLSIMDSGINPEIYLSLSVNVLNKVAPNEI